MIDLTREECGRYVVSLQSKIDELEAQIEQLRAGQEPTAVANLLRARNKELQRTVDALRAERETLLDQDRTNELQREVEKLQAELARKPAPLFTRDAAREIEGLRNANARYQAVNEALLKQVDEKMAEVEGLRRDACAVCGRDKYSCRHYQGPRLGDGT